MIILLLYFITPLTLPHPSSKKINYNCSLVNLIQGKKRRITEDMEALKLFTPMQCMAESCLWHDATPTSMSCIEFLLAITFYNPWIVIFFWLFSYMFRFQFLFLFFIFDLSQNEPWLTGLRAPTNLLTPSQKEIPGICIPRSHRCLTELIFD